MTPQKEEKQAARSTLGKEQGEHPEEASAKHRTSSVESRDVRSSPPPRLFVRAAAVVSAFSSPVSLPPLSPLSLSSMSAKVKWRKSRHSCQQDKRQPGERTLGEAGSNQGVEANKRAPAKGPKRSQQRQ